MSDQLSAAAAAAKQWLTDHHDELANDPAANAAWPVKAVHNLPADSQGNIIVAYNHCPKCGLVTRDAKYCPFDGIELEHVPPKSRCSSCTEQVIFDQAKFCGWCGMELAPCTA